MAEKILLVDDDLDTLRLVGLMLQRQGYEVRAANNGPQALTMAQGEQPDLILLDIMMPEMDGYEVARRLRANPKTTDIPIIMFTAKSQVDDKVLGFEAGADDYLTKPTQPREMFAHMKAVLARSKKAHTETAGPSGERGYLIGVTAVKGGLGVTTLAVNLGFALREATSKDVIVTDYRPGQGSIALELGHLKPEGLSRIVQHNPNEIDAKTIQAELVPHPSGPRFLMSSGRPIDARYLSAVDQFEALTKQLQYLARYIIIDLGPSLTPITEKVLPYCDEVIIVLEPVPHTVQQTKLYINNLNEIGLGEGRITLALINRIRSGVQLSWSQVQEQLDRNISIIFTPAPELAYQASTNNLPIFIQQPDSLTTQQFVKLAEKVVQRSR